MNNISKCYECGRDIPPGTERTVYEQLCSRTLPIIAWEPRVICTKCYESLEED